MSTFEQEWLAGLDEIDAKSRAAATARAQEAEREARENPPPPPETDDQVAARLGVDRDEFGAFLNEDHSRLALLPYKAPGNAEELVQNLSVGKALLEREDATLEHGEYAEGVAELQGEAAISDAVAALENARSFADRYKAVEHAVTYAPGRAHELVSELMQRGDIVGAQQVSATLEQLRGEAEAAWRVAESEQALRAGALETLKGELQHLNKTAPNTLKKVGPVFADILGGFAAPATADEARQSVALAFQGAREIQQAESAAKLLTDLDEGLHRYDDGGVGWQPFDREAVYQANFAEQINPERVVSKVFDKRRDPLMEGVDAEIARMAEIRANVEETNKQAQAARAQAEKGRVG